jgi:hypothetical protein
VAGFFFVDDRTKALHMKILIAFLVCGFAIFGSAQQSLQTFTSPNGLFRFQYSDMLINCLPQQTPIGPTKSSASEGTEPGVSTISDSCISQGEICDGPGSEGSTLACFAYPKERLKDKPQIVAASFYVSEIQPAKTEKQCLKGSPGWFVINSKAGTTTINHVSFTTFEIGDNWTSGGESGPAYRAFHDGKCYELGVRTVFSRAEHDPGTVEQFTEKDRYEVEGRLRQALTSFVFLK